MEGMTWRAACSQAGPPQKQMDSRAHSEGKVIVNKTPLSKRCVNHSICFSGLLYYYYYYYTGIIIIGKYACSYGKRVGPSEEHPPLVRQPHH